MNRNLCKKTLCLKCFCTSFFTFDLSFVCQFGERPTNINKHQQNQHHNQNSHNNQNTRNNSNNNSNKHNHSNSSNSNYFSNVLYLELLITKHVYKTIFSARYLKNKIIFFLASRLDHTERKNILSFNIKSVHLNLFGKD